MNMINEILKKQEKKTLKIFAKGKADFGKTDKFNPEYCAEEISEKLIEIAKKNLSQHGFAAMGADVQK
jgi:hypothetical protein